MSYERVAGLCVVFVFAASIVWDFARRRSAEEPREPAARVAISQRAIEHIRNNGNAVYVVGRGRSGKFSLLRATTKRPHGIECTPIESSPVSVFLDDRINPAHLEIGLVWWARRLTVSGALTVAHGDGGG